MSTFSDLPVRSDIQDTDNLVGYRTAAAAGEGRWTFLVLKTAILAGAAGIQVVSPPANSAASGAYGQISYDNGVLGIYVGRAGVGGPNWIFINTFERA
jgi:hypothetical protein